MKTDRNNRNEFRHGVSLLSVVIGLLLISVMGAAMAGLFYRCGYGHTQAYDIMRANYLAESGISYALTDGRLKELAKRGQPVTVSLGDKEQFTVSVTESNGLYRVKSIGVTDAGTGQETCRVIYRGQLRDGEWNPDKSPPAVEESTVGPFLDDLDNCTQLPSHWKVAWSPPGHGHGSGFERVPVEPGIGNDGLIATDMNARYFMERDVQQHQHLIGQQELYLDQRSVLKNAWEINNRQISYEVQVKMLWSFYRLYGAQGLTVMLSSNNKKDPHGKKRKSEGYYISLMRYHSENEEGEYIDTFNFNYDGIPNAIKPPGLARHRLLVVWRQWNDGKKREWLAYKDLGNYSGLPGEDRKDWVVDCYDGVSGRGFKDYATIAVRVIEARASDGNKYRYLQVLRADPKTNVLRNANRIGNDINAGRLAYLPERLGGSFPQWSPIDYNCWTQEEDYFTLQATLSDAVVAWDGVNTNGQTQIKILPDNGTIRSKEHLTPDKGKWPGQYYEIGLHTVGNFNNILLSEMYFDEFAVRFFINKALSSEVSGVQY